MMVQGFSRSLLSAGCCVLLSAAIAAPALAFTDTASHWASRPIDRLSSQGVLGGYPDGSFRPHGGITRAEFAATLVKAMGLPAGSMNGDAPSFRDVPASHWAYGSIEAVRANGLVNGYPGGVFMPNRNISRAESLAILANAARLPMTPADEAERVLRAFSDNNQVPNWARPAVASAIKAGFLSQFPYSNRLYPEQAASRAEVAAMTDSFRGSQLARQNPQASPANSSAPQQSANNGTNASNGANGATSTASGATLQGHIVVVPQGSEFTGSVQTRLTSETARVGDPVTLRLDGPLMGQNGEVAIPPGSQIKGTVRQVEAAGRAGKNGALDLVFDQAVLPTGQMIPLYARVSTEDGMLRGGSTKGRVLKAVGKTAVGAGLGAALGTAMGPLSGGKVGKGAIYGTAIGGGLGAATAVAQKGAEAIVEPGEQLKIKLQQSATFTP
ncbi:MAG: S-layer homology domain-containing protein [Vampirovibrionales bacterium]|nr:S-layer homology domain-containing protein [Vampirovibrionales bacterium]